MDYQFKVEYRPGKDNISDYTSRHPLPRDECSKQELSTSKEIKQYVNYMLPNNIPQAIGKEELKKKTWKKTRHCKDSRSVLRKDEWGILQT
jgi:methyltransferase-like protein